MGAKHPTPSPHQAPLDASLDRLGPVLTIGDAHVHVGTCSWADASLVKDANWYPRRGMKAAERLAFYAAQFPVVEADATYYFPPTPELAQSWAERTPLGFTFNVKAWSLLTGHPTFPQSLWEDLQGEVKPEFRDKKNLYNKHLSREALDECWHRFRHALAPLHDTGRLGGVLLQWPEWFGPKQRHRELLLDAQELLDPYRCFIEFRNAKWLAGEEATNTFEFLEANDLSFVCVDEPQGFASSMPPTLVATAPHALIRFHGHNDENWDRKGITAAERFMYLYEREELTSWAQRLRGFAEGVETLHVLFNNCWQDYGVTNAAQMLALLRGDEPDTLFAGERTDRVDVDAPTLASAPTTAHANTQELADTQEHADGTVAPDQDRTTW
jgi:uncharacterized protein YecE (DUF72 family)